MGYEEELVLVAEESNNISMEGVYKSKLDDYVFYVANKISLDELVKPFDEWLEN